MVVYNGNIYHAMGLSWNDHFVDFPDKPNSIRTELSVVVWIEDRNVFVVHQLYSPNPIVGELGLSSTDIVQQHLWSLFIAVDKQ